MVSQNIIYTTTFKLWNVSTVSGRIELAPEAWLESSANFKREPKHFSPSMHMFDNNSGGFGLSRFYEELLDSEVIIGTSHTSEESDNNPFDLHDCAYIAIAISILFDPLFVAGIETFSNNSNLNSPSLGPWTSLFMGKRNEKIIITVPCEIRLKQIYNFIFNALRGASKDESKRKLIFLYLRCIVRSSNYGFHVLKIGIEPILNERTSIIVNSALFFENIFTKESGTPSKVVEVWNHRFSTAPSINPEDIEIICQYRHTLVHDNATKAKKYITKWKKEICLSDEDAFDKVEKIAISTVKNCMRAIVENYDDYQAYRGHLTA